MANDNVDRVWDDATSTWIVIGSTTANAVVWYQASAPTDPTVGQAWLNSTTNILSIWSGTAWIPTGGTVDYSMQFLFMGA
jgi:hypothetical protein